MLRRAVSGSLSIDVDGVPVRARNGDSVAVALLAAGIQVTRRTAVSGAPRGPWCMMGACFDCIAMVDGHRLRTCMTPVQEGMRVDTRGG
jgi:predicted molibdopterin-dependent oxidoreductase YjgC